MDKHDVASRVDDWERRLQLLCEKIEDFYGTLPRVSFMELLKGQILQNEERQMREFDVPPRMLPTRAIL